MTITLKFLYYNGQRKHTHKYAQDRFVRIMSVLVKMKIFVIIIVTSLILTIVDGTGLKDDTSGALNFFELDKDYKIAQKRVSMFKNCT